MAPTKPAPNCIWLITKQLSIFIKRSLDIIKGNQYNEINFISRINSTLIFFVTDTGGCRALFCIRQ